MNLREINILLVAMIKTFNSIGDIHTRDAFQAMCIIYGDTWSVKVHAEVIRVLIEVDMLEMSPIDWIIRVTPYAKELIEQDKAEEILKPNMLPVSE